MVRSVRVRVVGAVVLASLIVLVLAAGVEAKLGATLSATMAHSGDTISCLSRLLAGGNPHRRGVSSAPDRHGRETAGPG